MNWIRLIIAVFLLTTTNALAGANDRAPNQFSLTSAAHNLNKFHKLDPDRYTPPQILELWCEHLFFR
jgi:hypothetical protein